MFDPVTSELLRSAPALPGLDPADLPEKFAEGYAGLVARRLRGAEGDPISDEGQWPLSRIADAYEIITSVTDDPQIRRAAAFVAATAQQMMAREQLASGASGLPAVNRDQVDPSIAAVLLFLIAEQYADAADAARELRFDSNEGDLLRVLRSHVADLAGGLPERIYLRGRAGHVNNQIAHDLEARATNALILRAVIGIEEYAQELLGLSPQGSSPDVSARSIFTEVIQASTNNYTTPVFGDTRLLTTYPGPMHLASLLLATYEATSVAAVVRITTPPGTDEDMWRTWIRARAKVAPFVWPNHRRAIFDERFYERGKSAVLVLPTGAGKTTLAIVKIEATIAAGRNVVFLAPTHALVEQLTVDLKMTFSGTTLAAEISEDFDRLFAAGLSLGKIEVMTPERCLALLSFAPEAFVDVGLLVFDECHLLSPESGLRRSLDAMFCVLAFNGAAPTADFLFLSAMIENGAELANWTQELTGRPCVFEDSLWKPTRQVRGVVIYLDDAIREAKARSLSEQSKMNRKKGVVAKTLRATAQQMLAVQPFAIFGLEHNWLKEHTATCSIAMISDLPVHLSGVLEGGSIRVTPNANQIAAQIAYLSARNGLKAIVFVNAKAQAVSTAKEISKLLDDNPESTPEEQMLWDALVLELGGLGHSLLKGPTGAVPHNAQMLRLERDLAERMFRRPDGARVIVATPTLAQGLNLPAQIAILAGDKRADPKSGARTALAAHEILNAAGRAGRAGHLANGVVLLIPEPVLELQTDNLISRDTIKKLKSVLPEDDRCLRVVDPLQVILDRVSHRSMDDDVEYALNRLLTTTAAQRDDIEIVDRFPINRSLAAYAAKSTNATNHFDSQVEALRQLLSQRSATAEDDLIRVMSAQSGAPLITLARLREEVRTLQESIPSSVESWTRWTLEWLARDHDSRDALLGGDDRSIRTSLGLNSKASVSSSDIERLIPGIVAWMNGEPLVAIEKALGGVVLPNDPCPRARSMITGLVPRGLSFVLSLVARMAIEVLDFPDAHSRLLTECAPSALRRGFASPTQLAFADTRKGLLVRRQYHLAFASEIGDRFEIRWDDDFSSLLARMRVLLHAD